MTRPTSPAGIEKHYVGKTLGEVPTPCAVLDRAKVEANCQRMLDAVKKLNIGWRAHVKSHKTIEITRLQVDDKDDTPVKVIVSTLLEAEKLLPLLKEYQGNGRKVNILYSFPLFPSCVSRIARLASELGPGAVSVLIDHPDQIPSLRAIRSQAAGGEGGGGGKDLAVDAFLKINMGNNRAGVIPRSDACHALVGALLAAHDEGACRLAGIYAHAGHSYATRGTWEAMDYLAAELFALRDIAADVRQQRPRLPLVLSAGATPTATSLQHPDLGEENTTTFDGAGESDLPGSGPAELETLIAELRSLPSTALEVHAGVYPLLDLQQLATHARSEDRGLAASDLALTVLAEVASFYPGRGYDGTAEALINAGTLALGREPCRNPSVDGEADYAGWGILMPWKQQAKGEPSSSSSSSSAGTTTTGGEQKVEGEQGEVEEHVQIWPGCEFPHAHGGWEVARISQEHGMLAWCGAPGDEAPLRVGQRVRVWPNHACIAGAMFDRYLVVDSRLKDREDEVVDVWERWRGW